MHATERRAAAIAVAVGFVLMAVKFVAWRLTGSSAVYSDALESIINMLLQVDLRCGQFRKHIGLPIARTPTVTGALNLSVCQWKAR